MNRYEADPGFPPAPHEPRSVIGVRSALLSRRSRACRETRFSAAALACLGLLLLPAAHPPLAGEPRSVMLVIDQKEAVYRHLIESVERELRANGNGAARLSVLDLSERNRGATDRAVPAADLYVAVGTQATAELAQLAGRGPLLSVLIPRLSFEKIFGNGEAVNGRPRSRSAIYLDQPFDRQLDLIRLVAPDSSRVGVALGPSTNGYVDDLSRAATARGLRLNAQVLAPDANLVRELDGLLSDSDAMLGIIDPLVFNRANAQKILLTAYRHRVPLIGASPAYVRAGALAAVYSTPEQIGRELGELVTQWAQAGGRDLPAPRYPRYFSVTVNHQVASSLGLSIESEERLTQRLGGRP